MRRDGPTGRDEYAEPSREALSTEDIARPEADAPRQPSDTADERATASDADVGRTAPRSRITDENGGPREAGTGGRDRDEPAQNTGSAQGTGSAPLIGPQETEDLRSRWQRIQQEFVDDPQQSVLAADGLVAEVMQLLATTFADHKRGLESQWHRGEEVATEDLRLALRQYRSFFDRLLTT
ncbi:hypothetical protein GCM10010433_43380 [Streptomyces pulveraceus]|uniref:Uncharacterized protein n=1 Tax=Streptomyces pulveraceus TaxID=68258 RepID=A0ABW1GEQ3_9ACTN